MDSRTAAHVLSQIAAYLELKGESSFKCRAYAGAAQGLLALGADDLGPLYRSGELSAIRGLGPATLAVVRDLIETGESRYLEQLRESTPAGLLDMLDVPGLSPLRIHQIHDGLGIESIEELEAAANDGRLATLPKFGPKTIAKILKGIASAREHGPLQLYHHARVEAQRLLASVTSHPDVVRAEVAGAIRRRAEVVSSIDIVAACAGNPTDVAQSFTRLSGVETAEGDGPFVSIRFVDGAELELHCVDPDRFAFTLWRATGTTAHVDAVRDALASNGVTIDDDRMRDGRGAVVAALDESAIYATASLAFVEPELREGLGEVDAARRGTLPILVTTSDIRGVLHCHSHYSDGKATIGEMAQAARERGWSYIGITDHSQAAFFAGGLSREAVRAQHDEIDELNSTLDDFRVLKGIEADILADGQLDYGDEMLDEFDFVVGAIHSRFSMDRTAMTDRVLRALDDPRLTILAHPTGRLLLSREPYAVDVDAVLEKAAALGVAVELNADPRRLDLDWRHLRAAKRLGATVAIGPDAHSTRGLDNMEVGVGIARKGWLERGDVLNARSAADVVAFARARRGRAS
jgi:DNA polymerase (family 10)